MVELRLHHVSKAFTPPTAALDDVSLTVRPGECLAVVGPSGCGKTTLLRIIAGLEAATTGQIYLDGRCVDQVPCHQRGVSMLFQRPALITSKTVRHNMRWLLGSRSCEGEITQVAQVLGLDQALDRPVSQLSGGEQQRVALGRCLLRRAKLCLLDEPLGHLDAPLRTQLRRQIRAHAQENSTTLLFVTHDPAEALAVGDRAAVMQQGRVVQVDEPARLRQHPVHRFVAELVHQQQGGLNCFSGLLGMSEGRAAWFAGPFGRWIIPQAEAAQELNFFGPPRNLLSQSETIHIIIGISAEKVACLGEKPAQDGRIQIALSVVRQEDASDGIWVIGRNQEGQQLIGRADRQERFQSGQDVMMTFSMQQGYGFDHATGQTFWTPSG